MPLDVATFQCVPWSAAHHGLEHQAQVAAVVEVAQQADDVTLALWVQAAQLPQYDLLGLPRLVPACTCTQQYLLTCIDDATLFCRLLG